MGVDRQFGSGEIPQPFHSLPHDGHRQCGDYLWVRR